MPKKNQQKNIVDKAQSWRANWRDEKAYPDPKTMPLKGWGWEFLRRNHRYQQDFARYFAFRNDPEMPVQEKTPILFKEWREIAAGYGLTQMINPATNYTIDPKTKSSVFDQYIRPKKCLIPRYRIGQENDDWTTAEDLVDSLSERVFSSRYPGKGTRLAMVPRNPAEVVLKFQLDLSILTQIQEARKILDMLAERAQCSNHGGWKPGKEFPGVFVRYLQILDAVEKRNSRKRIASALEGYAGREELDTIAKQIAAAKQFRDCDFLKIWIYATKIKTP